MLARVPEMLARRFAHTVRRRGSALGIVAVAEDCEEASGGGEPGPRSSDGPRVHTPAFFPRIVRRQRQAICIDVSGHEGRRGLDHLAIEGADELDVVELVEVMPERPQRQASLVLLDGQGAESVADPGMP